MDGDNSREFEEQQGAGRGHTAGLLAGAHQALFRCVYIGLLAWLYWVMGVFFCGCDGKVKAADCDGGQWF